MYERTSKSRWKKYWIFILADLMGFQLSFVISYLVRYGFSDFYYLGGYCRLAVLLAIIVLGVAMFTAGYNGIMKRGYLLEFRSVVAFDTVTMVLMITLLFISKTSAVFSRTVLLLIWAFALVVVTLLRIAAKKIARERVKRSEFRERCIIITTGDAAEKAIQRIMLSGETGYNYPGVAVFGKWNGDKICGLDVVANENNLLDYLNRNVIDAVFIEEHAQKYFTDRMVAICIDMGITVHVELREIHDISSRIVERLGNSVVVTSSMRIVAPRQIAVKRLMDIAGGIIGSALTLLLILIVTPVIKKQSPGPVIFKQTRIGKAGRPFTIYKIRTMYTDAEERKRELTEQNKMQGLMFKIDDDPRVYPFGRFLRRTSLDEFPQFFNVLIGNMSLVGTRPPTVDEYEQYEYKHKKRLSIKPGITGLWQISGRSRITDFDEIVRLDAEYITTWRILADVKILFKTVVEVIRGSGAQ